MAGASAIALLSGGLDSVVAIGVARQQYRIALALTCDYGQRAAVREIAAARHYCALWNIPHRIVDIPWLAEITTTALVARAHALPHYAAVDLHDERKQTASAAAVWVPNRNGLFLNIAGAFADQLGATAIIVGFNREEAATFSDNSIAYLHAATAALAYSTQQQAHVISPTAAWDKRQIVAAARTHDIPLDHCWSCYDGGATPCRICESCARFARATAV